LGVGLTTPPRNNLLLRNHEGGQDPHRVVPPVKKKKENGLWANFNVLNGATKLMRLLQKKSLRGVVGPIFIMLLPSNLGAFY
jgi:hypothetical protein